MMPLDMRHSLLALFILVSFGISGCETLPDARTPAPAKQKTAAKPPPKKRGPSIFQKKSTLQKKPASLRLASRLPRPREPKTTPSLAGARWIAPAPTAPSRPRAALEASLQKSGSAPGADAALFGLALYDIREKKFADAARRLQKLLHEHPLSAHYNESEYWLGLALRAAEKYDQAWLPLRSSLSRASGKKKRAILQAALGEIYETRRDPFAALLSYADALSSDTAVPDAFLIQNRMTAIGRKGVEAHQLLFAADRFRALPAGPILRYALALRAMDENKPQVALAATRRFLADYASHPLRARVEAFEKEISGQLTINRERVGVLLPLSGPAASAGERVLQGIQLALRDALRKNPNLRVQLAVRDTRSTVQSPGRTAEMARELIDEEKVVALIGPFFTQSAETAAPISTEKRTPFITPFAIRLQMKKEQEWMFRNSLTSKLQGQGVAVYAVQELGLRNFAVLYPDNEDGRELAEQFTAQVDRLGGKVVKLVPFSPAANDFGAQMRTLGGLDDAQIRRKKRALGLKKNDPYELKLPFEAIFIPGYHNKVVLIAPQIPFYNMKRIRLLGAHGWNNPDLIRYGEHYIEGAVFVDGFFPGSEEPRVTDFVARFRRLFGQDPGIFAALGYDTASILFEGLTRGASTRSLMREFIARLRGFDGVMGLIDMGPDGDAQRQLFVLTVRRKTIRHLQMVTPHRALRELPAPETPAPR